MKTLMNLNIIQILPNIIKVLALILTMAVAMALYIGSINKAMAASPTPINNVAITSDSITLGDVFSNITDQADFVLAPAPRPNDLLTWDARTIKRIVTAFDLPWTVQAGDTIQIRRLATVIEAETIKKSIKDALKDKGAGDAIDLEFLDGSNNDIILSHDLDATLTIDRISYNSSRNSFSASIRTADDSTHNITGVIHQMVNVPVLKFSTRRGETIGINDIEMIPMRNDAITDGMVVRVDELRGMTPRRIITAKSPILTTDLDKPTMVKRGELVTMNLKRGGINITALAKALEAGTKGDVIRLMNLDSKRTIEAQVTGSRTAEVLF